MLIVALCASLCALGSYAQQPLVLSLEQLFALADENSKTIQTENAAVLDAQQEVKVAKNALMPDIDISLSASYLGNGYLMERNFSNGQTIDMPHLGNNFAVEATQLLYTGGAVTHSIALAKLKEEMANINRKPHARAFILCLQASILTSTKLVAKNCHDGCVRQCLSSCSRCGFS